MNKFDESHHFWEKKILNSLDVGRSVERLVHTGRGRGEWET